MATTSLLKLLSGFTSYFRLSKSQNDAVVDNGVFRLHYRFTSGFFFVYCALLSAIDVRGNSMQCMITSKETKILDPINTFCWIQHTFTIPMLSAVSNGTIYPGVGPENPEHLERRVHSYYQWVPFILFFQGILFYLPHKLWKQCEAGRISKLTVGGRGFHLNLDLSTQQSRTAALSEYLVETLNTNGYLVLVYFLCELLNLVNAVGNIYFIDKFLGGVFLDYGLALFNLTYLDELERDDPLIFAFPRMTKCTFEKFGSSGSIEKIDALCILAFNNVHEKIYIFLWFWLVFLSILSILTVLYRIAVFISPVIRLILLRRVAPTIDSDLIAGLVRGIPLGDYLILHLLGKNLDGLQFQELLNHMARRLILFLN